ncbi:MAG: hypothetical protein AB1Z98_19730 [Nannocystaceae bacterium]
MRTATLCSAILAIALTGCSASRPALRHAAPAELVSAASVAAWENLSRPDSLHQVASWVALLGASTTECPTVERSENITILRGDCVDSSGQRHEGFARITTDEDEVRVRLRGYGEPEEGLATGRVRVWTKPYPRYAIDLAIEPGTAPRDPSAPSSWTAIDAKGHRDAAGTWHGTARLVVDGRGRADASATGIEISEACEHEPARGTMELRTEGHTARIEYDGATDCDPEGTGRWWLDGVEQGELSGIDSGMRCDADDDGGSVPASGAMLLLIGVRRRRAWASRT